MGRGILKQKKQFKHQYNGILYKDYQRVVEENKRLKEDPNSVVGQFLQRFNAVTIQNNRLSALAAALIDQLDGKAVIKREVINGFEGYRLTIKIETPEGQDDFAKAEEYIFTYEKVKPEAPTTVLPDGATPPEPPKMECTDPECTLPKDFPHAHTPDSDSVTADKFQSLEDSNAQQQGFSASE